MGVNWKNPLLHITAVIKLITAFGLTVTRTVKVLPVQAPKVAVGVTVYTAVLVVFVLLVNVPNTLA